MKLKTRLMYLNLAVIIFLTVGMVGYLLMSNYTSSKEATIREIGLVTESVSKDIEAILLRAEDDAAALGSAVELMIQSGGNNRDVVIDHLENVLKENPNYLYAWAAFEPNKFDFKDADFRNVTGSDSKGRFMPSWGKSGDELILNHCKKVEENDYYRVPKETGKFFIADPVTYELNGQDVTTVTFSQPVFKNGQVIGVIGLDISLATLRDISNQTKFFETGYGRMVSDKGLILAHPDGGRLNQIGEEFSGPQGASLLSKINNGEAFSNDLWSETLGLDLHDVYAPIEFQKYHLKWSYNAIVPYKEMMASVHRLIFTMVVIALIVISFMAFFMYRNSMYVVRSFTALSDVINRMSTLDLRFDAKHEAAKFLQRKDETGDMTRALASMEKSFHTLIVKVKEAVETLSTSSEELNATSEEVAMSSEEVTNTVEELANGATAQAMETESGASQINELGDLMNTNETSVGRVVKSSDTVNTLVDEGLVVIKDLIDKTKASGNGSKEIYSVIVETNKSADAISTASEMIASIAEQTNLLALNAAIEAARAGEAGKGFAVVAEEIRKLAEQSTASTKEIDRVVEELVNNSTTAVDRMEEVSSIIQSQVDSVGDTEGKYLEISKAINNASEAIGEMDANSKMMDQKKVKILEVVQSLSAIAEENAASTEEVSASMQEQSANIQEVASASEQLTLVANELAEQVDKFKL